jgi:Calpain family cysteine protease
MEGNWLPNPYALAQVLTDKLDLDALYNEDGKSADLLLSDAFKSHGKGKTLADLLGLFHRLAEAVKAPMPIAEVMNLAEAKRAAEVFNAETIRLLLPYLVPLSDDKFAGNASVGPSGAGTRSWFADSKQLIIDDASYLDPIQGAVGDCYLISAMIALAWSSPALLRSGMASTGFNPPNARTFQWQFHSDTDSELHQVKVSGRIPIAGKKIPRYAKSVSGESWPGLMEKAFVVKARAARPGSGEPTPADYQLIDRNATPQGACQSLVGGNPDGEILKFEEGKKIFTREGKLGTRSGSMSSAGVMSKPVMAWTKKDIGVTDSKIWEKTGLWPSHAYAVLGVMGDPDQLEHVVLRNPHGVATDPDTREGYAKGTWNAGEQSVELNQHGVFAITSKLFYEHFGDIGWVDIESTA